MRRIVMSVFLALLLSVCLVGVSTPAHAEEAPVVVIQIKGEIDLGQAALVNRAMQQAKEKNARAILVEIDTFGGLVDAAVSIRDRITEAPTDTICYIKNRAWSAGALISLAHKKIAIAPGGSIGAAEPIPASEKTIAALKAEFAATANKTGRNPRVAEAMVDKTLGLPGYAEPGKILALTDYQAVKVGYADLVAADRSEVLKAFGYENAPVIEYTQGWQEKWAGWLSNPVVKSALVSIIFLALLTEVKTAGLGVAALIGLVAAFLFYGSQLLTGLSGWLELILFVGGAVLILIELHAPGFGMFGIGGGLCILASFFLSLGGDANALNLLAGSMVVSTIVFLMIVRRLPSSRLWAKLVLKDAETTGAGYVSSVKYDAFLGKKGVAATLLRPAGVITIEGTQLDVVSEGKYIPAGTEVQVVSVVGNRIVVRPIEKKE